VPTDTCLSGSADLLALETIETTLE